MNFYFTRHGETEWNVKKKIQGTTDIPLDEKGIQQAKRLAETLLEKQRNGELHLDRVYTSPQLRAAETARFSAEALGIDCIRLWDLREMDLGDWEGRNWDEIREQNGIISGIPTGDSAVRRAESAITRCCGARWLRWNRFWRARRTMCLS